MAMNKLIDDMVYYAKVNNIPIIQEEGINFIKDQINLRDIKNILEIGSAIGYSAIMMCLYCNDVNVTTIERDIDRYNLACENINKCNLNNRIKIYNIDAFDYEDNNKYDLIFIDAAKAQYIKFFEKFKNNLNDNGIIITDNIKFHGMVNHTDEIKNRNTRQLVRKIENYIEFLKDNKEFNTTFFDVGDGIALSIKKSCAN